MAIEPDDILLDVLYEEIDAESGEAKEALTPELLAELEGWREFRESLGSEFKVYELSSVARASILDLAAKEVNESVSQAHVDSAIRRPPAHPEKGGFWTKLAGQSSQIALVASVLLVGAFVMNFQKREAPLAPSFEEVGFPSESAPPSPAEGAGRENEAEPALAQSADRAAEDTVAAEPTPAPLPEDKPSVDEERSEEQFARLAQEEAKIVPRTEPARRSRASVTKKALKPAPSPSASKGEVALMDDFLAEQTVGRASESKKSAAPTMAQPGEPAPLGISKGAGAVMDEDQGVEKSQELAPKKDVAIQVGTLDSLEAAYRARDYRRVVTESQQVMESTATTVQRARALELRAQAYKQMGMLQQSMETYRNLEANYPTYQTERVRASRVEVERQLGSTPQPASRPRQNRSYDSEAESVIDKLE